MGYIHINNLYKDTRIMNFKECYAMEKVHGTSARIVWKNNEIQFISGGMSYNIFLNIFNIEHLKTVFSTDFNDIKVIVYGEAYGGKEQGMSHTYGKEPAFIVFEVQINDTWLNVPDAENVVHKLGLEFVPYNKVSTDLEILNRERDLPSRVAKLRGILEDKISEGIVCKPLEEYTDNKGKRVIVKHKRNEFMETKTPRVVEQEKLIVLKEAKAIAEEWVTDMRFQHVIDKFQYKKEIHNTGIFGETMLADVLREAEDEIVVTDEAKTEIKKAACKLYIKFVKEVKQ